MTVQATPPTSIHGETTTAGLAIRSAPRLCKTQILSYALPLVALCANLTKTPNGIAIAIKNKAASKYMDDMDDLPILDVSNGRI